MSSAPTFCFFVAVFAGWMNRHLQQVIDFLLEENKVLKRQLKGRRLLLSDSERCRLAALAKKLGRDGPQKVATLVTLETLYRWHRSLVTRKWTHARKAPGRLPLDTGVRELIVKMATENPQWGYIRIQGALANVAHTVLSTTIANVLKRAGIGCFVR